jgi:hydroxymethylbilane synthase
MKDMPTELPPGLTLACVLEREDPRDVFISPNAVSLDGLPEGAVVGTASLRRQAQVLAARPDLKVITFRGNVQSRLRKLADGVVDATLLAYAGLRRLGMENEATAIMDTTVMLPAVAQGAITIETRDGDAEMARRLAPLNHPETEVCVTAERALLAALEGSCRTPIAAHAILKEDRLHLRARMLSPDGRQCYEATRESLPADAAAMGRDAGMEIRRIAGDAFFDILKV